MAFEWTWQSCKWPRAESTQWPLFNVISIGRKLSREVENFIKNLLDHMTFQMRWMGLNIWVTLISLGARHNLLPIEIT